MAAKSSKASSSNGGSERKPPAGFRRRAAVSEAPWFKNKEGNVAHGKLLGRYTMGSEPIRYYYQVELYASSVVTVGRGDDAEEQTMDAGSVVNVGETFKLECLKDVEIPEILAGAEFDVWVLVEKKIKISGGRTMWVTDVQTKQTKAPTSAVRPLPPDVVSEGEGEGASSSPF